MAEALTFENVESAAPVINENTISKSTNNLSFESIESSSDTDNQIKQNEKPQLSLRNKQS
jgi:hypothetical protein